MDRRLTVAYPVPITEIAIPTAPQAGGFWIRALARVLDWLVYLAVGLAVGIFLGVSAGLYNALTGQDVSAFISIGQNISFITLIGGMLGVLAHHTLSEGIGGATIGKRLVGLQVNDVSQIPCSVKQAFKRSLAFFYDGLFFGLVAKGYMKDSPLKQRWGDEWANTCVVKRRSVATHQSTWNFLGGLAAALVTQGLIVLAARLVEFAVHRGIA